MDLVILVFVVLVSQFLLLVPVLEQVFPLRLRIPTIYKKYDESIRKKGMTQSIMHTRASHLFFVNCNSIRSRIFVRPSAE